MSSLMDLVDPVVMDGDVRALKSMDVQKEAKT
jgi:hypothetical protein